MQRIRTLLLAPFFISPLLYASDAPALRSISKKDQKQAQTVFLRGAREYRDGHFEAAESTFLQAIQLDPQKREYVIALTVAQEHRIAVLIQQASDERSRNHPEKADALIAQAREIDPRNPLVQQHIATADTIQPVSVEVPAPAIAVQPLPGRHTFHFRSQTRGLVQQVLANYGVKVVFDPDVKSVDARIDVDQIDYDTATDLLGKIADVLIVPLDEHSVLVAADTQPNRERLERLEEQTIYLPGLSNDELNDLGNAIRNVFEVRQATVQPLRGTILLRAPHDTLQAIDKTLADLVEGNSEVVLRLQLYNVNSSLTRSTGMTLPQGVSLNSAVGLAQQIVRDNQSVIQQLIASGALPANATPLQIAVALLASGLVQNSLWTNRIALIGGGLSTGLLSATNYPVLQLGLQVTNSKSLDDLQLRGTDRQIIGFRSGTHYPIIQSTYSTGVSSTVGSQLSGVTINGQNLSSLLASYLGTSQASTVIPQVQFEDLGLTVKATPRVGRNGEVSLHLEMKIEALAGGSINDLPILTSRFLTSDVTVPAGDTAMVVSDLSEEESSAIDGSPGLSQLPVLNNLTSKTKNKNSTSLVLLLTPQLVRRGHLKLAGPYIPVKIRSSE